MTSQEKKRPVLSLFVWSSNEQHHSQEPFHTAMWKQLKVRPPSDETGAGESHK